LSNKGPDDVAFVEIEDVVPDGFADISNVSHNGINYTNKILWKTIDLAVNDSVIFSFDARVVHFPEVQCDYRNIAQVTRSANSDPDSEPNNDDGDQSEDDEDYADLFPDSSDTSCVAIDVHILLEGAYDFITGKMHTKLNDLGYLPGQEPVTLFGTRTEAGHPYCIAPWNYLGDEGMDLSSLLPDVGDFGGYPDNVRDYVLVSLRTDVSADSVICERAALLTDSGQLLFFENEHCCELDLLRSYYIVIQHRNHLPVMSHQKLQVNNGKLTYDFRQQNSYINALGFGQKEVDTGIFAMFAGNGEQTLSTSSPTDINVRDIGVWLKDDGFNSSYFLSDFDLNGDVNVQDKGLFLTNNGVFSDVRIK